MKVRNGVHVICKVCEKEFYVPNYRRNTAVFCSINCQNQLQHKKFKFNCLSCGKEIITSPCRRNENKKFCSLECREVKRKSEKERRLQTKAHNNIKRGIWQGRSFRKNIFKIKEKRCQVCGYDEYDFCLDIHHIDRH